MSPTANMLDTGSPFIEQMAGPDKGRAVQLVGEKLTIGRADSNDIVVASDGVSRLHAYLMQSDGAWYIRDNGSKNGILVNGQRVTESWLQNGDVIQVGNFVFRFSDPTSAAAPPSSGAEMPPMADMAPVAETPKKKPNRRVLIYVVVLGGLLYWAMGQNSEEGKSTSSGTSAEEGAEAKSLTAANEELEQVNARLVELAKNKDSDPQEMQDLQQRKEKLQTQLRKNIGRLSRQFAGEAAPDETLSPTDRRAIIGIEDPELKEAERIMAKLDWTNSSLREAEQFFRKGQREYLAGSYQRAIDSFSTALSFYRGHKLAENYLRRTFYEVEAEAKKHMDLGVQYFESLQYQRALGHFTEVVALMAHRPSEAMVTQAENYVSLCKKRLQAAELFP